MKKAMFVNQLSHNGVPYADALVDKLKKAETRSKNMLSALVGERVYVVRTVRGKHPMVIGQVDVVRAWFCPSADFQKYNSVHLVPPGSAYDATDRGKWMYFVENAERCEPFPLPASAIRHGRSWCEF